MAHIALNLFPNYVNVALSYRSIIGKSDFWLRPNPAHQIWSASSLKSKTTGNALRTSLTKEAHMKISVVRHVAFEDLGAFGPVADTAGQPLRRRGLPQAGPFSKMETPSADDYHVVNCEFHDVLESLAVLAKPVHIEVQSPEGVRHEHVEVIVDVFAKGGAEYIALESGEIIRLDHLLTVDSVSSTQFGSGLGSVDSR